LTFSDEWDILYPNSLKGVYKRIEMTDKPVESAPETPENEGVPTPDFSAASEGQQTSQGKSVDVDGLVKRLDEYDKRFQEIERREQSIKDKRLGEHDKRLKDLERLGGLLKEHGGDVHKAAREVRLMEAEEKVLSMDAEPKPSAPRLPGKEQMEQEYGDELADYLKERNIQLDPVEMREATRDMGGRKFSSVSKAVAAAAGMVDAYLESKNKRGAPANVGAMAIPKSGKGNPDLEKQYKSELLAARGQGGAVGREIRRKYRDMDVDVDHVVL
jgi:hypothetical protein